jgi:hypothetical protein
MRGQPSADRRTRRTRSGDDRHLRPRVRNAATATAPICWAPPTPPADHRHIRPGRHTPRYPLRIADPRATTQWWEVRPGGVARGETLHRDPHADGWPTGGPRRGAAAAGPRLSSSASPLSAGSGRRSPVVPAIVTGHGSPAGPVRRSGGSRGVARAGRPVTVSAGADRSGGAVQPVVGPRRLRDVVDHRVAGPRVASRSPLVTGG